MCAALWDERQAMAEPLRAMLRDAASVFPAVPGPYLRLLAATSHGPAAAAAAYAHLQVPAWLSLGSLLGVCMWAEVVCTQLFLATACQDGTCVQTYP